MITYDIITEYPYDGIQTELKDRYNSDSSTRQLEYCNHIFYAIHQSILFLKNLSKNSNQITKKDFDDFLAINAYFRNQLAVLGANQNAVLEEEAFYFGFMRGGWLITPFKPNAYQDYYHACIQLITTHTGKANSHQGIVDLMRGSAHRFSFQLTPLSDLDARINKTPLKESVLQGGPHIEISLQRFNAQKKGFHFHHLTDKDIPTYIDIAFFHFKCLLEAQKQDDKLEQLMRCIYYLDAASPYSRGSAEIVNIIHLALREHIGFPVRNMHILHILDRAVLSSLNYGEFRHKYLHECHPKFSYPGTPIKWDVFEETYKKNPPKVNWVLPDENKSSRPLTFSPALSRNNDSNDVRAAKRCYVQ